MPLEVRVAVGPQPAGVGGRAQLADEPQLLDRGLELRAEHAPLDPLERGERGLDGRTLPLRPEVRPQPGPQVAGAAHVEHLVSRAAEAVDAGPGRRAERERALLVGAANARRREPLEVGHGGRAAFLREADERDEDLRRRLRVGERPVAGLDRRAEEARERGEARATRPVRPSRARASGTVSRTGAASRRASIRSTARSRNARSKRALWATSTQSPEKARNRRIAVSWDGASRRSRRADPGQPR